MKLPVAGMLWSCHDVDSVHVGRDGSMDGDAVMLEGIIVHPVLSCTMNDAANDDDDMVAKEEKAAEDNCFRDGGNQP